MSDAMPQSPPRPQHEVSDVSGRRIVFTGVGLAAVLIIVALIAFATLKVLHPERTTAPSSALSASQPNDAPRLQSAPDPDLTALRREKYGLLHEYAWIDRRDGLIRIPIERAMQLIVERNASTKQSAAGRQER